MNQTAPDQSFNATGRITRQALFVLIATPSVNFLVGMEMSITDQPGDPTAALLAFDRAFIYLGTVTALAGVIALGLRTSR